MLNVDVSNSTKKKDATANVRYTSSEEPLHTRLIFQFGQNRFRVKAYSDVTILCVLLLHTLAKSTLGLRQIARVGTASRERDQSVGLRKDHHMIAA